MGVDGKVGVTHQKLLKVKASGRFRLWEQMDSVAVGTVDSPGPMAHGAMRTASERMYGVRARELMDRGPEI